MFLGDNDNIYNSSTIALLSEKFSTVHFVPFQIAKEWCENQKTGQSGLFFESDRIYKISIDGINQPEDFWKTI